MPYRFIHHDTGFVEFRKTPEEKLIEKLDRENSLLRKENEKFKKDIDLIKRKLGLADDIS